MKKLISLLAALSVVTAGTIGAFAADGFTVDYDTTDDVAGTSMTVADAATQETYTKGEDGLYTVDLATVAGNQDQTTILAVEGKTISVGSIKYINQSADKSFSFGMDDPASTVYVLAGGSAINPTLVGTVEAPSTSTGATVSGTVENFVAQEFYDEALIPCVEEIFGGEGMDEYKAAYATTAYLVDVDAIEEFIGYYVGDADEFTYVAKADVSTTDGSYSFSEVADGTYALIITRPSALPWMDYVVVEGEDVNVDSVELVLGDLDGHVDYLVDPEDVTAMVASLSEIGEDNFTPSYDIVADCLIDPEDITTIVSNIGDITVYGTELIMELFS